MSQEDIEKRIQAIRDEADDPEAAHHHEDALRDDFLKYVATLDIPIADKAKLVLSTNEIEFPRWCA